LSNYTQEICLEGQWEGREAFSAQRLAAWPPLAPLSLELPLIYITYLIRLAHCVRAFCFGRHVCRMPSDCCLSRVISRKLRKIRVTFHRHYMKSGSPSKNMTSYFALEVAK